MTNNSSGVHRYETCVSTGPQHLNPDPEIPAEFLTVGEIAQGENPNALPAKALLMWAFGLGFVDRIWPSDDPDGLYAAEMMYSPLIGSGK